MSKYKSYTLEQLEEHNSNYIISSLSNSKVQCYARNPLDFEKQYIYQERSKSSARTIAGQAVHYALDFYFTNKMNGTILSLPELEALAFDYIDQVPANSWKIQTTNPTVEDCILTAGNLSTKFLYNFYQEKNKYEDYIKEILYVELYLSEFITLSGVDIPLVFNMKIDLVILTHEDTVALIDHKNKAKFSSDEEIALNMGDQGIIYTKGLESAYPHLRVDELWIAENKDSKNKDGSSQIVIHKVKMDENVRSQYEFECYKLVRAVIQAVSDPDHVYIRNKSDNLADQAELINFSYRMMMCEIDDFAIDESKKDLIQKRHKKIKDSSTEMIAPQVIKNFAKTTEKFIQYDLSTIYTTMKEKIEHTLRSFGLKVQMAHELEGYSSNTYLLEAGAGVNISSILKQNLNIANTLNVSNVRILPNLMVYEGKSYVAIETSKKRDKDLFWDSNELVGMKIPIGKDNLGNTIVWDLENHSTPHMLVGGATGSGKSVSILSTIAYAKKAGIKEIYIFDPKFEFEDLRGDGTEVYNDVADIEVMLEILVEKMENKVKAKNTDKILIVFDEYADAIMAAGKNSELDKYMKRILQKGRSSGFRVLAATQRASVKIISGDMKVNFPVQICFRVPKKVDSKVMIDEPGAEILAGAGDGLIRSPEYADITRFQAFYKP